MLFPDPDFVSILDTGVKGAPDPQHRFWMLKYVESSCFIMQRKSLSHSQKLLNAMRKYGAVLPDSQGFGSALN
jgi:hypothetical protein